MTRFMMSLDDAVDLVLFAFENCKQGEIFIQKSSAVTINTLVIALKEIFKAKNKVKIMIVLRRNPYDLITVYKERK